MVFVRVLMQRKKPMPDELLSFCAQIGPEDGSDPRDFFRRPEGPVKNRKALQLCGQVAKTLNLALGACRDDLLRSLLVASVEPAPTSARLLVTVGPAVPSEPLDAAEALRRLRHAAGRLRSEVSAAVHRRKAPELLFRVVGQGRTAR